MKWIMAADTHANNRLPGNLEYSKQVIVDLGALAVQHGCRHIILAGDVMDQKHGLNLPVLLAVNEGLEIVRAMGIRTIILPGNHDLPYPEIPDYTPLCLLQKNATVVFWPRIVEGEDYILVVVPWMPPEKFRKAVADFTKEVITSPKKRILITHVSLAEGKVSPSNSIAQPIRLADLCPGVYQHVFLGDYHASQTLPGAPHVRYLGAPIPHTFGDYDNLGAWLFNTQEGERVLPLPSKYPRFCKWAIRSEQDIPLPDYCPEDRNLIQCPLEKMGFVKAVYPEAELQPFEVEVKVEGSRIENAETLTPADIFKKWREAQGLPQKPWDGLGEKYLMEVR